MSKFEELLNRVKDSNLNEFISSNFAENELADPNFVRENTIALAVKVMCDNLAESFSKSSFGEKIEMLSVMNICFSSTYSSGENLEARKKILEELNKRLKFV